MGNRRAKVFVLLCGIALSGASAGSAAITETLYGGTSAGGAGAGTGLFGVVDQATGAFTPAANDPTGEGMLPALACNASGEIYGMENVAPEDPLTPVGGSNRCGSLIRINSDGSVAQTFGIVLLSGQENTCTRITDLSFQPSSGTLFGLTGPGDQLVTITLTVPPVATVIDMLPTLSGDEQLERGGLAFRPSDGALFVASNDNELARISPVDASLVAEITQSMSDCIEALAFRPSDDVAFAVACDSDPLYTLNVSNGTLTELNADPAGTGESLSALAFCGGSGPTATPTETGEPQPTATFTPTSTATPTLTPTATGSVEVPLAPEVPTLSSRAAVVLILLLAGVAVIFIVRHRV